MKRLLLLVLLLPALGVAEQRTVQQYGVAKTVYFELYAADGTLSVSESDGGAEVTLVCDGDGGTTATNDFVDEGNSYSLALTAAELECKNVTLDIGATLAHSVIIETCGSPNAMHMLCSGGLYTTGGTSTVADNTTTVTELSGDDYADDDLNDFLLCIVEDITSGDPLECRVITDYNGTSEDATHQAFPAALPQNGEYIILPGPQAVVNVTNGVVDANTTLIEGADATDQINAAADTANTDYDAATGTEIAAVPTTAEIWGYTCEDQGATYTMQECMSIILAEAAGVATYTSGTRTWVVSDPSGSETRLTLVYGAELDGDRSTSTPAPMTP